jgi:hypothetical protein
MSLGSSFPLVVRRWPFLCTLLFLSRLAQLRADTVIPLGQAKLKIFGAHSKEEISDAKVAGDVNGDGFSDLVIGSELAEVGDVSGAGRAFLVFGSASLPATIDLASPGARGLTIEISDSDHADQLGHAVADAGDFNGDGLADFMVSAATESVENGSRAGAVYLIFGKRGLTGPLIDLSSLGSGGVKIVGAQRYGHAGSSLSRAGDFNGDGHDDIIIGTPQAGTSGRTNAGAAYVVYGGPGLPQVIDLASLGSRGLVIQGAKEGDRLGSAVGNLGDFNQDGLPDVIVSAPEADPGGSKSGRVYVVFGASGPRQTLDLDSPGTAVMTINGTHQDDRIGNDVSCGGDWNGDGAPDALIGVQGESPDDRSDAGSTYLVFGGKDLPASIELSEHTLGSRGFVLEGGGGGDSSGHSVQCVGDFNADGLDDFMIGADKAQPHAVGNSGQSYLVFGRRSSPGEEIELKKLGAGGVYLNGENAGDASGHVVADAGDLNGDGASDILVVAREASAPAAGGGMANHSGRKRSGIVYVFLGDGLPPVSGLLCEISGKNGVNLSWTLTGTFDSIQIHRNGSLLDTLPGTAVSYFDPTPPLGLVGYDVIGVLGGRPSHAAHCEVSLTIRPPFGLSCKVEEGVVVLTWQNAQEVDETRIYRDGQLLTSVPGVLSAFTDSDAGPGEHDYRVTAVVGPNESEPALCHTVVPAPVEGLTCRVDGCTVTLEWTASPDATGIRVLRDGEELAVLPGSATTFTDNESPFGDHRYAVESLSADGSSRAAECRVRVLRGIEGLTGKSVAGDVELNWLPPTEHYDQIEILRDGTRIAILTDITITTYTDPDRPPGSYLYTVVGIVGDSVSKPATVTVEVPAPVQGLTCSLEGDEAVLSWRLTGDADQVLVLRNGTLLATLPGTAETYRDGPLAPGSYSYSVETVRGNGTSAAATCSLTSCVPPAPVTCTLAGGKVKVTWTLNGTYDEIEVTVNGEVEPRLPGDATMAVFDLGLCGAARIEVRAICGGGRSEPAHCEAKEVLSPFELSCLAKGSEVVLEWQNGGQYDSIRVERDGAVLTVLAPDLLTYVDAPPPGTHVYRVFGVIGGVDTLPAVCHLRLNGMVSDLRCATDGKTVTLSWNTTEDHDSVLIERNGALYATLPAGVTGFTDPLPLTGIATYGVRLSTQGSSGLLATCEVQVLAPPGSFACRAEGGAVFLSWSNPEPYTAIVIHRNGLEVSPSGGLPGTATEFVDSPVSPGKYLYELQGLSGGSARSSQAVCEVEVLAFPIRLVCSAFGGEACLNWENPRAYDQVLILRDGEGIAALPGSTTRYCDSPLAAGKYVYEVRGMVGDDSSESARCEVTVPESPTDLTCSQEGADISLNWVSVAAYDAILIYRDGKLLSALPGSAASFLDTDVPAGTHTYEVRGGVNGDFSKPVSCAVAVVEPPRDLSCVTEGSTIRICWTPGDEYSQVVILRNGREIFRGPPPAGNCLEDAGLSPGVYSYEVRGLKGSDQTRSAGCEGIVYAPIFNLQCTIAGSKAFLSWSNGAPYDEIEVSRKRPSDAAPVVLRTLPGNATSFTDEPLTEFGTYLYVLAGKVRGTRSASASCSTAPQRLVPPAGLSCTLVNKTVFFADVELKWTNPGAYDAVVIRRNGLLIASLPGNATAYTDKNLGTGTYDYEVAGILAGNASDPAKCTAQVQLVPPPITNLNCRVTGNDATLTWSTERVSDETRIYRRAPGEASPTLLATLPDTPTTYIDHAALQPGDYRYEVAAVTQGVESSHALCDVHKPKAPSNLQCLAANLGLQDGDVKLTWTNEEAYDSLAILRDGQLVAVVPGTATSFLDTDRPIGSYSYRLLAIKDGNQSSLSAPCQATVPVKPPAVKDLFCQIDGGTATLSWTSTAVYDSLEIRRRGPGDATASLIATLPGDQVAYLDKGLSAPGAYEYSVTGLIGGRPSDAASCMVVLPMAPGINEANCGIQTQGPDGTDVLLTWENRDAYDSIIVVRIRIKPTPTQTAMVSLRGDQTSFVDRRIPDGEYSYAVVGTVGTGSATSAPCSVVIARPSFIRSELNNDNRRDVADAIYLFNFLFIGGPRPTCLDAADVNDDGRADMADAIWIISYQFRGGPPPFAPFPACGKDPTDDELNCLSFPGCR